jgi:hypothetical protein
MISTDGGMQIDVSDGQDENASESISFNLESGSNETVERRRQSKKHHAQRHSTEAGIMIDSSDEHCQNPRPSIRFS